MVLMALVLTCLLMACEVDDYETGDGEYSFMRADFANVHTGEAKVLTSEVWHWASRNGRHS